ncbi:MAG TPA: YaiI/YqxD family protein [Marinagarivorans sp.]
MQIWVDADACPNVIKDILFKAAKRRSMALVLVANQPLRTPPSPVIRSVVVPAGFDVADNYIVQHCQQGDLLITADIPLAAEVIALGVQVISPRGERFTANNIEPRLAMRNFMEQMRNAGQASGGPPPLNHSDRQAFANALDRLLAFNAT